MGEKIYIGDGCYAELDEFGAIILTTSNGVRDTNRIVLDPEVYTVLVRYVNRYSASMRSR